jgi:hypothetical protein
MNSAHRGEGALLPEAQELRSPRYAFDGIEDALYYLIELAEEHEFYNDSVSNNDENLYNAVDAAWEWFRKSGQND